MNNKGIMGRHAKAISKEESEDWVEPVITVKATGSAGDPKLLKDLIDKADDIIKDCWNKVNNKN